MNILGMDVSCEEYEIINSHILANYKLKEWNGLSENFRKDFIQDYLNYLR